MLLAVWIWKRGGKFCFCSVPKNAEIPGEAATEGVRMLSLATKLDHVAAFFAKEIESRDSATDCLPLLADSGVYHRCHHGNLENSCIGLEVLLRGIPIQRCRWVPPLHTMVDCCEDDFIFFALV